MPLTSCFLCAAAKNELLVPVLDRPVRRENSVGMVVTGAGALSIGYVLIAPERHYTDLASALRQQDGFLEFVERSLEDFESLFGDYTFWEHGSASLDMPTSGCVAHAHLNVVPSVPLSGPADATVVDGFEDLARRASSPYLLVGGSRRTTELGRDSGVSQHYRREWARLMGDADRWDYAVGGFRDLQRETAERYAQAQDESPQGDVAGPERCQS